MTTCGARVSHNGPVCGKPAEFACPACRRPDHAVCREHALRLGMQGCEGTRLWAKSTASGAFAVMFTDRRAW